MLHPRLRTLAHRTFVYYRMYGATATARKILRYVTGRRNYAAQAEIGWSSFNVVVSDEFTVPHNETDLTPVGPLTARITFVQEIEVGFDSLAGMDLLVGTYKRRNSSKNQVALFSGRGDELFHGEFSSLTVSDNQFHPVTRDAVDLRQTRKVLLVVGSLDGSKTDAITLWKNERVPSRLIVVSKSFEDVRRALKTGEPLDGKPVRGSLVFRAKGARSSLVASYQFPTCPPALAARRASGEMHALVCLGEGERIAPLLTDALKSLPSVEVTRNATEAIRKLQSGNKDLLFIGELALTSARPLLQTAYSLYVPSLVLLGETLQRNGGERARNAHESSSASFNQRQLLHWTTFALCGADESTPGRATKRMTLDDFLQSRAPPATERSDNPWQRVVSAQQRLWQPKVSIVTILYNKAREIGPVLESYFNQSYEGPLELVFVDDCSSDSSVRIVNEWVAGYEVRRTGPTLRTHIVRNERNMGNCVSRNVGIEHASGDIIVIIDADCMINRDYIKRHVEAHAFDDCEVVIGPMNLETSDRDPLAVLEQYEAQPDLVAAHCLLQDPLNKMSFLNCITRNFSIKASAIDGPLFDPLFSYSADPDSGFGWEDVELGVRLYKSGARIKYVNEAFSIHVSPGLGVDELPRFRRLFDRLYGAQSSSEDASDSRAWRSMRNFRRLFDKHSDLEFISRRWAVETYGRICDWTERSGITSNEDRLALEQKLGPYRQLRAIAGRARRYRVLTYRWHVSHQYELYKLPFDFTLVTGLGSPMTEAWDFGTRPMPANARFAPADRIDPNDYDFAILHFDENVLAPENTNGVIGAEWGRAFQWFVENVQLPKIGVCHGTPQFHGQYNIHYDKPDLLQVIESERTRLVDYMDDMPVVVNSYQAQREWRFRNSRVIWHGFDPADFPPALYERGILSPLGPLVLSRPHYRGYFLYRKVFEHFPEAFTPDTLRVPEPHVLYTGNAYAVAKYRNYVDEIRRYSVYFNPTQRSPMPRARGEPMMCGVVTVNALNHDVDMFIRNGVNGFYSNDPEELREFLLYLVQHPDAARRIGAEGRRTAMDVFNHDRYLTDWLSAISDLLGETVNPSRETAGEHSFV